MENINSKGFAELSVNDTEMIDGGMPLVLGVLVAGGIVVGTGIVVSSTVYGVGKFVQWAGDKITGSK